MQTKAFNHSSFRVCVYDIQTTEQCVLGGWFVMCMSNHVRKPPVHVGGRGQTVHTDMYSKHSLIWSICKTYTWPTRLQPKDEVTVSRGGAMLKGPAVCLCTVITHSEFLSLPRTLMLTSIYFLEIHLHTVA